MLILFVSLNGGGLKNFLLKLMVFNFFYKINFYKKTNIKNNVVILNSPFHYKLPKTHLGIQTLNFKITFYIKKKNTKNILNFFKKLTVLNFFIFK